MEKLLHAAIRVYNLIKHATNDMLAQFIRERHSGFLQGCHVRKYQNVKKC